MPEGDTVWNTARLLHDALAGRRLASADLRVPALATVDLTGWTVLESASRGKHLLLRLAGPDSDPAGRLTLHSHLRMDGAWRVFRPDQPWRGGPAHTIRAVLRARAGPAPPRSTAALVAVGYHLHDLALAPTSAEHHLVGHLGPDLLGADWDPAEAARRLAAQPDATIGEALLDQRNLAGIGNLYKCELLFLRGISPWTPVGEVRDLPALVALAYRLLAANRGRWTQSTTGSLRRGQTSYVYGRRAQPCRRCAGPIHRRQQGDRITYWCPTCQPGPPGPAGPEGGRPG